MSQRSNEIDISPMLNDINKVLKGHLTSILGPIINEKNAINNILLNMPYVKKLQEENRILKLQLIQYKTELTGIKNYYEKELENASKKNVKLEVRDSLSNSSETPSKIVELKQQMWRKNEKVNSQDENEEESESESELYGEEEEDDEEEDDDDDDYESPIIANLRMSSIDNNKTNEVVEVTSNGTIETSDNEENTTKNITVWNLNSNEENPECDNEQHEEEDNGEGEEGEEEEEEDDEEEDDEEEDDEEEEEGEDKEEEVDDDESEEVNHEDSEAEEDDEEELDVEDVEIDGVQYLTTGTENGEIYKCDEDGEIMEDENGDFIICGYFKNGIANFI